jgi:AraC-like DNA-binding protein
VFGTRGRQMTTAQAKCLQFPQELRTLTALTDRSAIAATRFNPNIAAGEVLESRSRSEDAYLILFQLRDYPEHEIWTNGKVKFAAPVQRGTIQVIDLTNQPFARFHTSPDTLVFHLPNSALQDLRQDCGARGLTHLKAPDEWNTYDPVVASIAPLVLRTLDTPNHQSKLFQEHLMLSLGAHIADKYCEKGLQQSACKARLAPWQEKRAKEMLISALATEISIRDVALECKLSTDYFARAFKGTVGTSPYAWLQVERINKAKDLLENSNIRLTEIAEACGFADQSHLTRMFVRHARVPPGSWRRMRRG